MPGNKSGRDKYRFDVRDKQQFKKDIADSHKVENKIIKLWLDRLEDSLGKRPAYRGVGCGPDGRYLEAKDVNSNADYEVDGFGRVEVKFSKPLLTKHFHLKVDQVKSYLDQDASILMINGWNSNRPEYVFIPAAIMRQMVDELTIVSWIGFGLKLAYRIPIDKFVWRRLK